jgi:lipopolysaccharide biosynthesis protein
MISRKNGVRIGPVRKLGNILLRNAVIWKIFRYVRNREYRRLSRSMVLKKTPNARLAIVLHLYYPDLWSAISKRLEHIDTPFDLFVSVQQGFKGISLPRINEFHESTSVIPVPNRGRDVLPFLFITRMLTELGQHDYVLKLHSKKSPHRSDGNDWLASLLDELIPENISNIIDVLKKPGTGAVGPASHVVSLSRYMGANRERIDGIVRSITSEDISDKIAASPSRYPFFGGTMFWCRMDYLSPLLKSSLAPADFNSEKGQIDGTTAHAIERMLGRILHEIAHRKMYVVKEAAVAELHEGPYTAEYKHV